MSSVQSWFVLTMSHCVVSFPNHLYLIGILCNDFYSLKIYFFRIPGIQEMQKSSFTLSCFNVVFFKIGGYSGNWVCVTRCAVTQ